MPVSTWYSATKVFIEGIVGIQAGCEVSYTKGAALQAAAKGATQTAEDERLSQLAQTANNRFKIVAGHAVCYADQSELADGADIIAICMVPERSANELWHPMRPFRAKYKEEQCFVKLSSGYYTFGSTISNLHQIGQSV